MNQPADADVVVVGAGHNGLVAAGYLAAAGKRVLVFERNDYVGGGVASAELTEPGFISERHALLHVRIMPNPLIAKDELGLQRRYGLEYVPLDIPMAAVFEDESYIPFARDRAVTMAKISEVSPQDAAAYDEFMQLAVQFVQLAIPGLFVPPKNPVEQMAGLDSSAIGREMLRVTSMSVADVLAERFVDERVRIAMSRLASGLTLSHPEDFNSGSVVYLAAGMNELYGMALPRGGGSEFTNSLVRCIEDNGGEIRTSVTISKVLTRSGRAVGVSTSDGTQIHARDAVLASIHPHSLADAIDDLDPVVARSAARAKLSPHTAFVVHASLDRPLQFKAGSGLDSVVWNTLNANTIGAMNEAFDALRRGRIPAVPLLEAGTPSSADPTRAPDGKTVLHMLCLAPRDLADGGPGRWHSYQDAFADNLVRRLSEFTTNFDAESVRVRTLVTPLDHEIDSPSFAGGDYTGLASFSHQMGAMRPTRELSRYTVPGITRLYLTGPFMHPGGGVTGGGRATAMQMFAHLGLDPAVFSD